MRTHARVPGRISRGHKRNNHVGKKWTKTHILCQSSTAGFGNSIPNNREGRFGASTYNSKVATRSLQKRFFHSSPQVLNQNRSQICDEYTIACAEPTQENEAWLAEFLRSTTCGQSCEQIVQTLVKNVKEFRRTGHSSAYRHKSSKVSTHHDLTWLGGWMLLALSLLLWDKGSSCWWSWTISLNWLRLSR